MTHSCAVRNCSWSAVQVLLLPIIPLSPGSFLGFFFFFPQIAWALVLNLPCAFSFFEFAYVPCKGIFVCTRENCFLWAQKSHDCEATTRKDAFHGLPASRDDFLRSYWVFPRVTLINPSACGSSGHSVSVDCVERTGSHASLLMDACLEMPEECRLVPL
jgi:hypothetical protein